jgi:hypothetical protein
MAVKRTKKPVKRKGGAARSVIGVAHRLRKKPKDKPPAPTEVDGSGGHSAGVMRVAPDADHLPEAFIEAGEGDSDNGGLVPGRVMLTITLLVIAFIAIMAYFVSQMPNKQ